MSGGTGGHLWPAVALSEALHDAGHRTSLLTEGRQVEQSLLSRAGCESLTMPAGGHGVTRLARLPRQTLQARRVLRDRGIDAVVGTGGGATVPVGLAARLLGLPLCLLEQNTVVGRANRMLRPIAQRLYMGLPTERRYGKSVLTGTPLRGGFGAVEKLEARRRLGLVEDAPTLLVTGGSQGAAVLNETVPPAVCATGLAMQVVHLAGEGKDAAVRPAYFAGMDDGIEAIVRPMSLDMPLLFAAADLVICRGGGCTVSELIVAGRPAIIVPYPHHADMQQLHNGRLLERAGAAIVIEQSELDVASLTSILQELMRDVRRLGEMGERAAAVAPSEAAHVIVDDLERVMES